MSTKDTVSIALIDDHKLFRRGLANLIEMVDSRYRILFEAESGDDMRAKLSLAETPDIVIMDINMPGMDGYAAVSDFCFKLAFASSSCFYSNNTFLSDCISRSFICSSIFFIVSVVSSVCFLYVSSLGRRNNV